MESQTKKGSFSLRCLWSGAFVCVLQTQGHEGPWNRWPVLPNLLRAGCQTSLGVDPAFQWRLNSSSRSFHGGGSPQASAFHPHNPLKCKAGLSTALFTSTSGSADRSLCEPEWVCLFAIKYSLLFPFMWRCFSGKHLKQTCLCVILANKRGTCCSQSFLFHLSKGCSLIAVLSQSFSANWLDW